MARPSKQGIDYFPLDVYLDNKFKFIEIKFGLEGFGIVIKILQNIYGQGYWSQWGEDEKLLFAAENNVSYEKVENITNECIHREIFNKVIYEKYKVITSNGIQKRYKEVVRRRRDVEIIKEYTLFNELLKVNDDINYASPRVIDGNNPTTTNINDDIYGQSKVEESRLKDIREESSAKTDPDNSVITEKDCVITKNNTAEADALFESIWKLYPNKSGKSSIKAATKKKLLKIGLETLNICLERYKKDLAINTWKQPMNGSTFFNGRYADYLDENYEEMKTNGGNEKHGGGITDEYKREWSSLGLEIG